MVNIKIFLILLVGEALLTSPIFSSDYTFFFPFLADDRAWFCDMDSSGTITFRQEYQVGYDWQKVGASSNGRLAIVSSPKIPHLSCFFINRDGSIDQPIYNNEYVSVPGTYIPILFHPRLPLVYVGFWKTCNLFSINYNNKSISMTGNSSALISGVAYRLCYSKFSNQIIFQYPYYTKSTMSICGIKIADDGSFTSETHRLDLGLAGSNSNLCVSPDGKWAVVLGGTFWGYPRMSVIGIAKDGSLSIVEQWYYNMEIINPHSVRYTPNGKYLLMMNEDETKGLISYSVNQDTGKLTVVDWLPSKLASGWDMAISPDGKFAIIGRESTTAVVKIMEDGKLVSIKTDELPIDGSAGDREFIPPWRDGHNPPHGLLVH